MNSHSSPKLISVAQTPLMSKYVSSVSPMLHVSSKAIIVTKFEDHRVTWLPKSELEITAQVEQLPFTSPSASENLPMTPSRENFQKMSTHSSYLIREQQKKLIHLIYKYKKLSEKPISQLSPPQRTAGSNFF